MPYAGNMFHILSATAVVCVCRVDTCVDIKLLN